MMTSFHEIVAAVWLFLPAIVANMAPVLVQGHFEAVNLPLDGGRKFRGRRIFGDHKTWRGLVSGVIAGIFVYELQRALSIAGVLEGLAMFDYAANPVLPGYYLGLGALVGDAVKSFFKRQMGIRPGGTWIPFDQLDFFVGAWLFVMPFVVVPVAVMVATAPFVLAGSVMTTVIGYRAGWKEAWI